MIIVLIASIIIYFLHLSAGTSLFPDSQRYLQGGKHSPFHFRWLLPFLLRDNQRAWHIVTGTATVLIPVAMFYFLESWGLTYIQCVIGGLLTIGLRGVFRFNVQAPVLVDAPAMLLMVISATMFNYGLIIPAVAVAVLAGCIKESTPLFISILSLNIFGLIGFLSPLIIHLFFKPDKDDILDERSKLILENPVHYGLEFHKGKWLSYELWLSWGVCLLAFKSPSYQLIAMFIVAYAQMLLATDSIRLWHWAFPVMILYAVPQIPIEWAIPLIVLQWINPFGMRDI